MSEQASHNPIRSDLAALEALLFASAGPVTLAQLAEAMDIKVNDVESVIVDLSRRYIDGGGLRIQRHGGRIQLTTAPELAPVIEKFLGLESMTRLSRAALETLTIVAYRQPITRPGIDAVRGVNSDGVLKSLLSKGLVQEVGRTEGPGRPILYGTTAELLQHFGLSSIDELPPFEVIETEEVGTNGNGRLLKD